MYGEQTREKNGDTIFIGKSCAKSNNEYLCVDKLISCTCPWRYLYVLQIYAKKKRTLLKSKIRK